MVIKIGRVRQDNQCKKPKGWLGRITLRRMNRSHSSLTDWGLSQISIGMDKTILDVGCGGGRTISKLAARASRGRVYGIDYSEESVAATRKFNAREIDLGRVDVRHGSVSQMPFADGMFDLVTGVETHFWWPNLSGDLREVFRVTKPGGTLILIVEVYKGAQTMVSRLAEKYSSETGMNILSVDEHRGLLLSTGFSDVRVIEEHDKGWLCAIGNKPAGNS